MGLGRVVWATTEIVGSNAASITFRVTQPEEVVVSEVEMGVLASEDYSARVDGGVTTMKSRRFEGEKRRSWWCGLGDVRVAAASRGGRRDGGRMDDGRPGAAPETGVERGSPVCRRKGDGTRALCHHLTTSLDRQ